MILRVAYPLHRQPTLSEPQVQVPQEQPPSQPQLSPVIMLTNSRLSEPQVQVPQEQEPEQVQPPAIRRAEEEPQEQVPQEQDDPQEQPAIVIVYATFACNEVKKFEREVINARGH
ncbi:hypothetical protein V1527DRAFT_449900 [Lipomyces starkeyi]